VYGYVIKLPAGGYLMPPAMENGKQGHPITQDVRQAWRWLKGPSAITYARALSDREPSKAFEVWSLEDMRVVWPEFHRHGL
jgi:hypothetical protein